MKAAPIIQYRMGKGRIPDGACDVSDEAFAAYSKARELGLRGKQYNAEAQLADLQRSNGELK